MGVAAPILQAMNQSAPPPRHLTKIVATIGPRSSSREIVAQLVESGIDCARINASHGDHDSQRQMISLIREEADKAGRTVAILYDLQGPKIRIGNFSGDPIEVHAGDTIALVVLLVGVLLFARRSGVAATPVRTSTQEELGEIPGSPTSDGMPNLFDVIPGGLGQ